MNNIIEAFISIQGEGALTGHPSLFVRLGGCNLRCVFHDPSGKATSTCDTAYASFGKTETRYKDDDLIKILKDNPQLKQVVITGGEPLLQQFLLVDFIERVQDEVPHGERIMFTVETNGTIDPTEELLELVDLWSVSPKLKSSEPNNKDMKKYGLTESQVRNHSMKRINVNALTNIYMYGHNVQFKFVYTDDQCITEIENIAKLIESSKLDIMQNDLTKVEQQKVIIRDDINDFIMLMPEGITDKSIDKKSSEVVGICLKKGWQFSTRLHILIWGNVREK